MKSEVPIPTGIFVSPTTLNTDIRQYVTEFKRHGPLALVVWFDFICTQTGIKLTRDDVRCELRFREFDREKKRKDREVLEARKESELRERHARKKQ